MNYNMAEKINNKLSCVKVRRCADVPNDNKSKFELVLRLGVQTIARQIHSSVCYFDSVYFLFWNQLPDLVYESSIIKAALNRVSAWQIDLAEGQEAENLRFQINCEWWSCHDHQRVDGDYMSVTGTAVRLGESCTRLHSYQSRITCKKTNWQILSTFTGCRVADILLQAMTLRKSRIEFSWKPGQDEPKSDRQSTEVRVSILKSGWMRCKTRTI